ncbi:MAG: RidA family protein [Myxococcota bacterium]
MTIRRINPPELFNGEAFGMSQGSVDDGTGFVFLSGQVAWDKASVVQGKSYLEQTKHALENLRIALDAAGSARQEVLHLRIYVRGEIEEHMEEVAPALASFFGETRPAVTGIGVQSLATRDTLVELEAVARVV